MAATKKITLYYHLSTSEIFAPPGDALARKEAWIKGMQKTIAKQGEMRIIKVTYELFNPEIERQQKFFNGPVISYFAIQDSDILDGPVTHETLTRYRETLLSQLLGYEVQLVEGKEKRRKSTTEFQSVQKWHDFLERVREEFFEPNGYQMPDSEAFWEMAKKHGYEQAKTVAIEALQESIRRRLTSPQA